MKFIFVLVFSLIFTSTAFATHGDKQDAVHTVEKLEKLCSAGVSYGKFMDALADAEAEVALFRANFDSPDNEFKQALLESLGESINMYKLVGKVWALRFLNRPSTDFVNARSDLVRQILNDLKELDEPESRGGALVSAGISGDMIRISSAVRILMSRAAGSTQKMLTIYANRSQ